MQVLRDIDATVRQVQIQTGGSPHDDGHLYLVTQSSEDASVVLASACSGCMSTQSQTDLVIDAVTITCDAGAGRTCYRGTHTPSSLTIACLRCMSCSRCACSHVKQASHDPRVARTRTNQTVCDFGVKSEEFRGGGLAKPHVAPRGNTKTSDMLRMESKLRTSTATSAASICRDRFLIQQDTRLHRKAKVAAW